jgi:phosphopantetheinyl transferase
MSSQLSVRENESRQTGLGREPLVQTIAGFGPESVVLFASGPAAQGIRIRLAQLLLDAMVLKDSSLRSLYAENVLYLHKTSLGQPFLLLGDSPGPSLSYSLNQDRIWAAMSSKGSVGIDVARFEEFFDDYPFSRAFLPEEFSLVSDCCSNDIPGSAALLWSLKEAAVKAIGTGFNHFDPLTVRVSKPRRSEPEMFFEVMADRPITTWSKALDDGWLSVALT